MTRLLHATRSPLAARLAGALACVLGASVLVAWAVGQPGAASVIPNRPAMLPSTALGLALCGMALWLLAPPPSREPGGRGRLREALGRMMALAAFLVAVVVGWSVWRGQPLPLAPILFARGLRAYELKGGGLPPAGSSPNEISALALAALAILTLDVRAGRIRLGRFFAVTLLALVLVAVVGLTYGTPALYGVSEMRGMALPTVIGYAALTIGVLLARPHDGAVAVLLAKGSGGAVARRLLPVALLLPLVLGGVLLVGEDLGWYSRSTSTALLVSGSVLILGVAVVWSALAIERREGERARLLEEAQEARARADEASAAKSRFLATMSHELRTPLNAILGYTELMELGVAGPVSTGQRDYHERVRASGRHLLGLINEVLDFSKLEAGHITVDSVEASTVEAMAAAMGLVRPQAAMRGVELRERLDTATDVRFTGDPDRVRQVLVNLLSNAVKFTRDGGTVEVSAGAEREGGPFPPPTDDGWTYVRVSDTGIGISTEEQERVFEPFVQLDEGHTRRAGGTGLGLAIARRLSRLMGGDLTLESRMGQGSRFTLWLPGAPALAVAATDTSSLNVGASLKANVDAVVDSYVDRLRADPSLPMAASTSQAALEDHTAALITDLAQHLVIIDEGRRDAAALIRDGVRLQRRMCELHGAQRWNLGWPEAALNREFAVLKDVIDECLRTRTPVEARTQVDDALQVMHVFLHEATTASREGWKRAARRGLRAMS